MRLVIFGIGAMYQKYKPRFKKEIEIVALIDNQAEQWGKLVDGVKVYAPEEVKRLKYDAIFLLSVHGLEMRMQLRQMGILQEKIYMMENHIELLCEEEPVCYYGAWREALKKNKGKRILIFSHALTSTGAQNVLYQAVHVLQKNNFQIIVVSKEDGVLRKKLEEIEIPVLIIRDIYAKEKEVEQFVDWADQILVNTLLLYDTVLQLLKYNRRLIWWIHETGTFPYILEDFKYIATNKHVSVYAVSGMVKKIIEKEFEEELGIKELRFGLPQYEWKETLREDTKKIVFAVVGYIGYIKGQDVFLDAIRKLPDLVREKAEFWIVGGGDFLPGEWEVIEKYPCIKVLGEIENTKISAVYSGMDVIVCPSRIEAMSVAVTEACMAGKMAIVSDAAGITEYIEHGKNGFIFQSEQVEELAKWMEWAVEHPALVKEMGEASKEIYKKYFSIDIFEENLLAAVKGEKEDQESSRK